MNKLLLFCVLVALIPADELEEQGKAVPSDHEVIIGHPHLRPTAPKCFSKQDFDKALSANSNQSNGYALFREAMRACKDWTCNDKGPCSYLKSINICMCTCHPGFEGIHCEFNCGSGGCSYSAPAPGVAGIGTTCTLTGGESVQIGWSGSDTGNNDCNTCTCGDESVLICTMIHCACRESNYLSTGAECKCSGNICTESDLCYDGSCHTKKKVCQVSNTVATKEICDCSGEMCDGFEFCYNGGCNSFAKTCIASNTVKTGETCACSAGNKCTDTQFCYGKSCHTNAKEEGEQDEGGHDDGYDYGYGEQDEGKIICRVSNTVQTGEACECSGKTCSDTEFCYDDVCNAIAITETCSCGKDYWFYCDTFDGKNGEENCSVCPGESGMCADQKDLKKNEAALQSCQTFCEAPVHRKV